MDKVAVSRAVARLLGDDRIRRAVHRGDRRRSVLALTPKGQRIYDQIAPRALEYERQLLQVLDAEEREWLERLLAKLTGDGLEAVRRIPLPRAGGAPAGHPICRFGGPAQGPERVGARMAASACGRPALALPSYFTPCIRRLISGAIRNNSTPGIKSAQKPNV